MPNISRFLPLLLLFLLVSCASKSPQHLQSWQGEGRFYGTIWYAIQKGQNEVPVITKAVWKDSPTRYIKAVFVLPQGTLLGTWTLTEDTFISQPADKSFWRKKVVNDCGNILAILINNLQRSESSLTSQTESQNSYSVDFGKKTIQVQVEEFQWQ